MVNNKSMFVILFLWIKGLKPKKKIQSMQIDFQKFNYRMCNIQASKKLIIEYTILYLEYKLQNNKTTLTKSII